MTLTYSDQDVQATANAMEDHIKPSALLKEIADTLKELKERVEGIERTAKDLDIRLAEVEIEQRRNLSQNDFEQSLTDRLTELETFAEQMRRRM